MKRVLFVCTGNTCRSGMAEALLRRKLQDASNAEIGVESAGTSAFDGDPASPHAVIVVGERGVDHSGHRARQVTREILAGADLILTMTERHRQVLGTLFPEVAGKVCALKEFAGVGGPPDIADPFGGTLEDYRGTMAEIDEAVTAALPRILALMSTTPLAQHRHDSEEAKE